MNFDVTIATDSTSNTKFNFNPDNASALQIILTRNPHHPCDALVRLSFVSLTFVNDLFFQLDSFCSRVVSTGCLFVCLSGFDDQDSTFTLSL